ncbi:MAG TPA: hypothetical protein PLL69_05815 [Gemmatimonadales bacterium]|nr:hypothetical protein [Gemmatimonadales bacterium]
MMGEHRRHGSRGSGWLYLAMMGSAIALMAGLSSVTSILGPASILIWLGVMAMGTAAALGPIGKAIARRISGDQAEVEGQQRLSEDLYAELDELRGRMVEVEERQDFSERLLTARDETGLPSEEVQRG